MANLAMEIRAGQQHFAQLYISYLRSIHNVIPRVIKFRMYVLYVGKYYYFQARVHM